MENVVVQKTRIIGTNVLVFSAWEPVDWHEQGCGFSHSTVQFIQGRGWYGRIGTRRFPSFTEHTERDRAYRAIAAEYPGLIPGENCQPDMGQLVVYHSDRYPASTFECAGVRA